MQHTWRGPHVRKLVTSVFPMAKLTAKYKPVFYMRIMMIMIMMMMIIIIIIIIIIMTIIIVIITIGN